MYMLGYVLYPAFYLLNAIGSMSPTEYNSSSLCWCTDVFMEQLRCTLRKVAHEQLTPTVVNTCGLPVSGR